MPTHPRIRVSVSAQALRHNVAQLQQHAPHSRIMAVIKSNAYGHGLSLVAQVLNGHVGALAVRDAHEAQTVLDAGCRLQPVCALEGALTPEDWHILNQPECWSVLHHLEQITMLKSLKASRPWHVWLKIDVGMGRLGFFPEQVPAIMATLRGMPCINVVGLLAHCSSADAADASITYEELKRFSGVAKQYPQLEHSLSNSAALLHTPETHWGWVRPGLALYGVTPQGHSSRRLDLKPVMSVHSRLMSVRDLPHGSTVGYARTWQAGDQPVRVAHVGMGYGDGYPRHVNTHASVWLQKGLAPIIGRVSMDRMAIDLSQHPKATLGDPVEVWGAHHSVALVAQHAGTSPNELMTQVAPHVPRTLIETRNMGVLP